MSRLSFIKATIDGLSPEVFNELKDVLIDEYIPLSFMQKEDLDIRMLEELINDYFEKTELVTGRSFERLVENYMSDLNEIVDYRIKQQERPKKNRPAPPVPRAWQYYEKAQSLRNYNRETKRGLLDYTRIMLCLYIAIITNDFNPIDDFNYALNSLNLTKIIDALHKETRLLSSKPKFNLNEMYGLDRNTFVLVIIMYYYMKNNEVTGDE